MKKTWLLEAALLGYQAQLNHVEGQISVIRLALKKPSAPTRKRHLSSAARKRIAEAQKKRWAEYRRQQAAEA